MKKNYFVEAYLKNMNTTMFWDDYFNKCSKQIPYILEGKIKFKERSIEPTCSLKSHIFIIDGK